MTDEQIIIEELKQYVLGCKSDVKELRSNIMVLEDTLSRINYIQGLLNDLSNMS